MTDVLCFIQFVELLRKSSEHTLVDMVQLLFSRLPQFKEDPKWATNIRKVCCFSWNTFIFLLWECEYYFLAPCSLQVTTNLTCSFYCLCCSIFAFSAWRCWLGGRKGIRSVKTEWWGAGMVISLQRGADLHMVQLIPLPLTISCFSKIQIGFTFLVLAHPGSPGKRAVKQLCVFCSIFGFICFYCVRLVFLVKL